METLINPHEHVDTPASPPSGHDGDTIAQRGDVKRSREGYTAVAAVEWPPEAFHLIDAVVTVPTVDTFGAALAVGDPAVGLGPYASGDADTEDVRVCNACPLGPALAALAVGKPLLVQLSPPAWARAQ